MNKPNYKYGDNSASIKMGNIIINWNPIMEAYALPIGIPDDNGEHNLFLLIETDDDGIHWTPRFQIPLEESSAHTPDAAAEAVLNILIALNFGLDKLIFDKSWVSRLIMNS